MRDLAADRLPLVHLLRQFLLRLAHHVRVVSGGCGVRGSDRGPELRRVVAMGTPPTGIVGRPLWWGTFSRLGGVRNPLGPGRPQCPRYPSSRNLFRGVEVRHICGSRGSARIDRVGRPMWPSAAAGVEAADLETRALVTEDGMKLNFLIAWSMFLVIATAQSSDSREEFAFVRHQMQSSRSFVPRDGYVPDADTAMAVAYAVAVPIYGKTAVDAERPFRADLEDGKWLVLGRSQRATSGGTLVVQMEQATGKILYLNHSM